MGLIRELHGQSALGFFKELPDFLGCISFLSSQIGKSFIFQIKLFYQVPVVCAKPCKRLLYLGDQCLFFYRIRSGFFHPVFGMQLFSRFPRRVIGNLLIWMGKLRFSGLVHPFTGFLNALGFQTIAQALEQRGEKGLNTGAGVIL